MSRVVLALALAACGGGGSDPLSPDANPMDSGDGPDPTRVDVNVQPITFGTVGQTIVVFYDETDAVVSHGEVDADGNAHGSLPHGGSVTAVRSTLDGNRTISISTIHHVEPGDQLTFDDRIQNPTPTGAEDVMTATYTAPTTGDFSVERACGQTGTTTGQVGAPLLLHFFESCTTTAFDMLLTSTGAPKQFLWMPDIPYSGGASFVVPNSWQSVGTLATTFTNLAATTTQVSLLSSTLVGSKRVQLDSGTFPVSTASPTVNQPWPVGGGRGTVALSYLESPTHPDTRMIVGSPSASTITIDVTALPLPTFPEDELPVQTVDGATWNQSGAPAGDLRAVAWQARNVDAAQIHNDFFVTVFDDPTTPTTMTLLPLPDEYADRDPTKVTGVELVGSSVRYVDYDTMTFAEVRLHAQRLSTIESAYLEGPLVAHSTLSRSFFRP